jgi:hypothetical protein
MQDCQFWLSKLDEAEAAEAKAKAKAERAAKRAAKATP